MEDKRLMFEKGKQRELFLYFFNKYRLSQNKLASKLGLSKTTISSYLNEENNMTNTTFQQLISVDSQVINYKKFIVEKLPLNGG